MQKAATLSSKNQVTVPTEVRKVLGLKAGETVVFQIDSAEQGVTVRLRRYPSLDEVAGSVPVPPDIAGLPWEEIRARAWAPQDNGGQSHE